MACEPWHFGPDLARKRAMITIILVVHLMIAAALIGVILLQKSEGGALGMGGGGMSGFMTGRSTANLLTRTTAILAAVFFLTSITLALLAGGSRAPRSVLDQPSSSAPETPAQKSAPATPASPPAPAAPAEPSAPLAK
jgi:preprotein translocase subunit SecG